MNKEEIESLIKQLKAAGLDEEQIMETFFETFQDGKMDRKDLETLANFMGYELTDDFKEDSTPDPIAVQNIDEDMSDEELKDPTGENKDSDSEEDEEEWEKVQKQLKW